MPDVQLTTQPPEAAVDFFKARGYQIGWDWKDVWQEQHARAFTVAKAMDLDLLQDIRNEVEKALSDGLTFDQFRKSLEPRLRARGWWGKKYAAGPDGQVKGFHEGTPWRLRTIFRTNLQTAYAAGRYRTQAEVSDVMPYLMYDAVGDERTRPKHEAMDGTVYPFNDPFWQTNYPPNDWGCRCVAVSLSEEMVRNMGLSVDRTTGKPVQVAGEGWAYHPGRAAWDAITPEQVRDPERWIPAGPNVPGKKTPLNQVPDEFIDTFRERDLLPSMDDLLARGMNRADAETWLMREFLGAFGADIDKPKIIRDVIGDHVRISDALFLDRKLTRETGTRRFKVAKRDRDPYLKLLAETVKDPYEIWMKEYRDARTGKIVLRKRYLKVFRDESGNLNGISVFEHGNRQWDGVTVFKYDEDYHYEKQRQGVLLYRKN